MVATEMSMPSPTYAEIATEVRRIGGFVPKNCWIAHVKSEVGLTIRIARNRAHPEKQKYPCPPDKLPFILKAMRGLGM